MGASLAVGRTKAAAGALLYICFQGAPFFSGMIFFLGCFINE